MLRLTAQQAWLQRCILTLQQWPSCYCMCVVGMSLPLTVSYVATPLYVLTALISSAPYCCNCMQVCRWAAQQDWRAALQSLVA